MLFRVQVVPGVLKCRRRTCKLPQHGLDPRIARYITEAGFEGLFKVPNLELDHSLITALVERWHPEMHTFHLPYGEMGITLQDIEVMLGVRVDGLPMTEGVKMNWPTLCFKLLGHRPPDSIPHPHENTSILAGARLIFTWLDVQAVMQGIGDEGDADWRSCDVGAAVGVFEVPTDMPCYEVATTASGGWSPCESVCYLISLIQLSCHMSFTVHVSIVYATSNTFTKDIAVEK